MDFFSIGHSTRPIEHFLAMLAEAGVRGIADVRRFPMSRRHPQFNREALEAALADAGIAYRHVPEMGGRRGKADPHSPNGWWEIEAFRAYADHALTPDFRRALQELREWGAEGPVAVMCAEALWWQCHRRLVVDNLLAARERVTHLLAPGKQEPAKLSEGARVQPNGTVLYPPLAVQSQLVF